MSIIYAPILQEVPAFISETETIEEVEKEVVKVKVRFQHNPAVSESYRNNIKLILKDNNSKIVATSNTVEKKLEKNNSIEVIFKITNIEELNIDQFYKCQIAYYENEDDEDLHYSEIAMTKYIGEKPELQIAGVNDDTGVVKEDLSGYKIAYIANNEPLYKYCFSLYQNNTELIQTSGWLDYYTNDSDNPPFIIYKELLPAYPYKLILEGITANGLELSVENCIIAGYTYECNFNGTYEILGPQDSIDALENGYINIKVKSYNNNYCYELLRREIDSSHLELITRFNKGLDWKDCTIEQGMTYEYLIRNIDFSTPPQISRTKSLGIATADFEYMYLSDYDKQLKIKFNPQVSSLKSINLEQKIDTIGGQYPFFFRNGNVNYKEIPISGLISYHTDDQEYFLTNNILQLENKTTNLTSQNIAAERKFKLEVLNWLTNGQPKLFRSPTEGNYVVRLMNTSLSPNDTLGRMLHTFSTTGYECMSTNYQEMIKSQVVKQPDESTVDSLITYYYDGITVENEKYAIDNKSIYNITLTTEGAILDNMYIKLDGKTYYITNNIFSTPISTIYNSIEIPCIVGQPFSLTYRQKSKTTDLNSIQFPTETSVSLFSIFAGTRPEDEELPEGDSKAYSFEDVLTNGSTIENIYAMSIEKVESAEYTRADYLFTLNGSTIDCSDGQIRYYSDIKGPINVNQIRKGKGLHVNFYGIINATSSELGHFILGVSKLGGE